MPWIDTIAFAAATGKLRTLYDRITGPGGNVDNIMRVHSLRPHTMEGHMALYKAVLHHSGNRLDKWFLECIGVWVSMLNHCDYCTEHHFAGMKRLMGDDARANALRVALAEGTVSALPLSAREKVAMIYARNLTLDPAQMTQSEVEVLRAAGYDDGEILEINQVTAYFAYANRTVLGLGCSMAGDIIGLSPGNSNDTDDWGHH